MCKNDQRRQEILRFVNGYRSVSGISPTVREIADGVGLRSASTTHGNLMRMARDGLLTFEPYERRTVMVAARSDRARPA